MNKTTGYLYSKFKLNREERGNYELIIQASEYCDLYEDEDINKNYNPDDLSSLKVKLVVEDINDNVPYFDKKVYKVALSPEVVYRDTILEGTVRVNQSSKQLKFLQL